MQFNNHSNYNCEITADSGETYRVYANWLHNNKLDNWKGWQCQAGATRLMIDKNFNVYSGECKNDHLGHALEGFNMLNGTLCKQETCSGCTDDLMLSKNEQ